MKRTRRIQITMLVSGSLAFPIAFMAPMESRADSSTDIQDIRVPLEDSEISGVSPAGVSNQRKQLAELSRLIRQQQLELEQQRQQLLVQMEQMERQQAEIEKRQRELALLLAGPVGSSELAGLTGRGATDEGTRIAANEQPAASGSGAVDAETPSTPVGEAPPEPDRAPPVPVLVDVGGVLTPKNTLVTEPQIEFAVSNINRFFFEGVQVVEGILIGEIEATEVDRIIFAPKLGFRYGITNRLEISTKIPYFYRSERSTRQVVNEEEQGTIVDDLEGYGLGDIDFGVSYQMNRGRKGWPFFVGNLRVRAPTGTSPFEVDRGLDGIETELATGTGFWAIQPNLTIIHPSDPVVIYGNISYLWNLADDVDTDINTGAGVAHIGEVDPGDSIGFSFGMGVGLNQRSSFSLGYDHQYVRPTLTEFDGESFKSEDLHVGSFLFGLAWGFTPSFGVNLTLNIGVTEDAPDMRLTARFPFSTHF